MKSAAVRPCSRTLVQTYAQAEPSTHAFGMVNDCALRSSKPAPIAIAAAAAAARPLRKAMPCPFPSRRRLSGDSAQPGKRNCNRNNDCSMNGAGECRRPRPAMALGGRIAYVMAMTQPHRPVGPGDHVFLVDGSSFVFRAYYQSIRQDQKYNYRTDRLPTGAMRLFATKVLQFIRDGAGRFQADPSRHDLRQDGELVPARHLSRLQGAPEGSSRRTGAAVSPDARHGFGLRHGPDRAGPLRGRRHHRHLRPPGPSGRRRRAHRLGRQGPDAARRAGRVDVRSSFRPSRRRRLSRGAALRPGRGGRIFRRRPGQGGRRPGARRRLQPTTCPARQASGSRPRLSSSPNTATSRRCLPAQARSNSPSAAKR